MGAHQRTNWGGCHWMNLFDFNLYGDPALSLFESFQGTPPTATTTSADEITTSSVRANGTINPNGFETTYYFEYGETVSYSSQSSHLSAGSDGNAVNVEATLSGLTPATLYHCRLVAGNATGTNYGNDTSFTTASAPPVNPPVANFMANPTTGPALLYISFTDNSTHEPTSWSWNFGDGDTSSEQNPTHIFAAQRTYSVTLTACNAGGCSSSEVKVDFVNCNSACGNDHIKIGENYYASSLQDTYDNNLATGETLLAQALNFTGNLTLNQEKNVSITGGYDCSYSNCEIGTTLNGVLTITRGTVIVSNLIIQ